MLVCAVFTVRGSAAEADFVGLLAMAVDEDVAGQIGLTDETKTKLKELIDRRVDEAIADDVAAGGDQRVRDRFLVERDPLTGLCGTRLGRAAATQGCADPPPSIVETGWAEQR